MTDIQAAVGREQLKRLPGIIKERRALADAYTALLADIQGLELPQEPEWARSNWQSYCVRLPAGTDQRRTMQDMLDAGISTRRGIMCSHREDAYHGLATRFPMSASEEAQDHCIMLPLYPGMADDSQQRVVSALRDACK